MSDHIARLRWVGNQLATEASDKGIGQGSEGARYCWEAAIEMEYLRNQLVTITTERDELLAAHKIGAIKEETI